ncbi:MAG: Glutaredoxin-like protein, YruB-family [Candidatus Yanofskybacteria bacterium GW2011_GWF2_43_596]|nr:MAG: Glutaredoxin-like protein, YruB-family [Candidatus Yanofskybacteria bacterium GW2011_GWF2_43_596]
MAKIKIYSTEYFKSKGLEYEEFDVMSDIVKRQEMIDKTGQMGVPVIDIDNKLIIGFDRSKIDEMLG